MLWWGWQLHNTPSYRDTRVSKMFRRLIPWIVNNLFSLEYLFFFVRVGVRPWWPSESCQLYSPIHSEHVRCQYKEFNCKFWYSCCKIDWQDMNSQTPARKRTMMDAFEYNGTKKNAQPAFASRRSNRMPTHGRSVEGKKKMGGAAPIPTSPYACEMAACYPVQPGCRWIWWRRLFRGCTHIKLVQWDFHGNTMARRSIEG